MKFIASLIFILLISVSSFFAQQKELSKGEILFHSIEKSDLQASSSTFKSKIDLANKTIEASIPVQSFKFQSEAHQKDFISEGNMNSSSFPILSIKGNLSSSSNLVEDRRHIIVIEGEAVIKGKKQSFKTNGLLVNKNGVTTLTSSFLLNGEKLGLIDSKLSKVEVSVNLIY